MDIRKNQKGSLFFLLYSILFFFSFLFFFFLCAKQKGTSKKKLKDYFVSDSYLFYEWIEAYSGSELWGVLPYFFYQLKAPICILFILCGNALLENLHNLHY